MLLAWVVFTSAMPLGWALAAVAAAVAVGPLVGALAGLVPTRRAIELRHFLDVGSVELLRAVAGSAWQLATLLSQSRLLVDAAARAFWRMAASRRHLLQWTSSAQAQAQARHGLGAFLRADPWICVIGAALAVAALVWGATPLAGAAIFSIWALGPLLAWWSSRPAAASHPHTPLEVQETRYLESLARDTWKFFEDVVGEDDNHLPPDNLQLEPEPTLAHRTSPTNIGMYLLASCCAREFGWIDSAQLLTRLDATLAAVERLEHFHGHLYNWYDTRTLQVLRPAYVSSVDSGNLAGHLLCVAQACRSLALQPGEERVQALEVMAQRCEAMCHAMDFRGLYDSSRHLFHIGLRVQEMALDASYYDLLASESRLLSFLAIAKGDVPRRHWQALGRPFLSLGFRPGLKSWAGSMFEYLMPALVMPEPAHSLLDAANRSAILEQERLGAERAQPWGVSESAYYAQDHSLAFQYSPFGVPRLALRRTPPGEQVVAPYASMMAAPFAPQDAVINLQVLQALGARGEYGFFDAVDFTPSRQTQGQAFSVVHNFMAHHQGMSLVALCNLLRDDAPRRWFASAPLVQAHEALLHERTPRQIIGSADPRTPPAPSEGEEAPAYQPRTVDPLAAGLQPTHLLSNGRYTVSLRANGAGVSRWHSSNVSRWRDDPLRDGYGAFFFLREELDDGPPQAPVSLSALPAPGKGWRYRARFLADHVRFDAEGNDLQVRTNVLISPEDDTELRTVAIHNTGHAPRTLELISYFEPVLSPPRHDEAHPAFTNLFVQTQWKPAWRALLLTRKPRLHGDAAMSVAHFVAAVDAHILSVECMADRRAFIGRNRSLASPALHAQPFDDHGQPVNGLDPIACLRLRLRLEGDATARITFATTAAEQEEDLLPVIDRYLQPVHVQRATRMAATLAQVRLRDLSIEPAQIAALQDLTSILTYTTPRATAERHPIDLRQIWRFGISGDKPIVLVHIHASEGMRLLNTLLRAQPWWGFGGVACDLVVINSEPNSYLMPLQREIQALRDRVAQQVQNSFPRNDSAGFYLLREQEIAASEKAALSAHARAVFTADGRPLELQVAALRDALAAARAPMAPDAPAAATRVALHAPGSMATIAAADTSPVQGTFDAASGEFHFEVNTGRRTPRPWVNVIANPRFGFQVSEAGAGFTWAGNSRMHQLTPWSNDPVQDPVFEHYLLQDLETRALVALTPETSDASGASHRVRHGQGYTVFEGRHAGLETECTFFADRTDSMKVVQVRVKNTGSGPRRLRPAAVIEWQMGAARGERRTVTSWKHLGLPAVFGQQRESGAGFGGSTAFLMLAGTGGRALQWTSDRNEFFLQAMGALLLPDTLSQRAGSGLDACAAVSDEMVLVAGETASFAFLLGHGESADAAEALAERWAARDTQQALDQVRAFWDELLGRIEVKTPDPLFDALVNRWLPYQTLGCRMWARAGFYQAGGAFGFRDQLQDAMAFALSDPVRLREQVLMNASRQFPEGDVQHWWHMPSGAGVRTHFSDDLLWLPYACAHYIEVSGDLSVLDEVVPFIEGAAIPEGAEDAYYTPETSRQSATVFEHCARCIDRSLKSGVHGLPLMGTGDWNDGMNRVGHEGRGESVWLAWFLCDVIKRFAPLAQRHGQSERAAQWLDARQGWIHALHQAGWDGAWFRRAFFDDGTPLGSSINEECRIDLIAQSWSVLSGASHEDYTAPAMRAVKQQLTDHRAGLLRLLHPPLAQTVPNAGYIQAYPPGVRENGGQYSHGAVWAMMAQALQGDLEAAWESFRGLSPAHRAADPRRGPHYEIEPYVMPGDIYGASPYEGRGGWSWYTGSAAWMHRAAIGTLLGLEVHGDRLRMNPRVPPDWPAFELVLRLNGRELALRWSRENGLGEAQASQGVRSGEWLMWKQLPPHATVHITSAVAVPA
ncbi:MAG TPA: glucoamylase family protein [Variovorax sp.]|nr:glucoamylase family protein [Variovorax sp.]